MTATPTQIAVGDGLVAAFYGGIVWAILVRPWWPWDWRGNRRARKARA